MCKEALGGKMRLNIHASGINLTAESYGGSVGYFARSRRVPESGIAKRDIGG